MKDEKASFAHLEAATRAATSGGAVKAAGLNAIRAARGPAQILAETSAVCIAQELFAGQEKALNGAAVRAARVRRENIVYERRCNRNSR